jgi:hypothetical protein
MIWRSRLESFMVPPGIRYGSAAGVLFYVTGMQSVALMLKK